jgi:uncharacterized membrane protein YqjE
MVADEQRAEPLRQRGLLDSVKTLAGTLLSIGSTRLALLSTELEEEIVWRCSMLIWTLVGLFCAGVGAVLVTVLFAVIWWESNRLIALGLPAIVFLLGAVFCWRLVIDKARAKPALFSASLAEISKDRQYLTPIP